MSREESANTVSAHGQDPKSGEGGKAQTRLRPRPPRKHPRVWLVARVESRASGTISQGRTDNISVGGVLVFAHETFEPRTEVVVHFKLPDGRPIEAPGLVVHSQKGVQMGIHFVGLPEADQKAIGEFVDQVQPYTRRRVFLPRRLCVLLRWQDLEGAPHEELAQTLVVSRQGGVLVSPVSFKAGQDLFLWWPEGERGAKIRIVFRKLGGPGDSVELGFEFVEVKEFWGIEFPPETTWWEAPGD